MGREEKEKKRTKEKNEIRRFEIREKRGWSEKGR